MRETPPTQNLTLPDAPQPDEQGRLFAPSAARNCDAICALVTEHAPTQGRALEIASGTGQHTAALAQALPALHWHPTDVDDSRLTSIAAYCIALENVAPPQILDALTPGWAAQHSPFDLILTVNLLHLIPAPQARVLLAEAAQALAPGGVFILYGPFLRDGETTSEGDAAFHTSLRAQNPAIGYKDDWDVIDWIQAQFLDLVQVIEMPANNLAFVARKP